MRDVAAECAPIPQPHRGDADAFTEHLLGCHVERSGHAAADIGPVAVGLRERDRRIIDKDRPNKPHVGKMRATGIGIIDGIDIARLHIAFEETNDLLACIVQGTDMNRDIGIALRDRISVYVIQRIRKIPIVDHKRIACPQYLLGHLIDSRDERVLQHLEGNRIEGEILLHGHLQPPIRMTMLRNRSTLALHPRRDDRGRIKLLDDCRPLQRCAGRQIVAAIDRRFSRSMAIEPNGAVLATPPACGRFQGARETPPSARSRPRAG